MPTATCDLVVRYNEQEGKITLYAIPSQQTEELCRHAYVGFMRDAKQLLALDPAEAEQWVGRMVFSELDLHSKAKIGIRDYVALAREDHQSLLADLERRVLENDQEAAFQLFMQFYNSALKEGSQDKLERADSLLASAAARGHQQAIELATAWPRMKSEAERNFRCA